MLLGAIGGTAAAVLGLLVAEVRGHQGARALCKTAASAGFLATGVLAGLPLGTPPQQAVFAGLVLGAIGDLCLLGTDKRWFLAGIGAFLLNHLAYALGFLWLGLAPWAVLVAALPLGAVAWGVWRTLRARVGRLAGPVLAYIAVITAMVACAAGALGAGGPGRGALFAGAVLFFVSDLAVARNRFVAPGWSNKVWGLPTYYAAQLVFAALCPPG